MMAVVYYLLKVILCCGVLFLYYHIALRNKLFHQWNRFYLVASVVISIIAPVVQVSIMHPVPAEPNKAIKMLQVFESADGYLEDVTVRSGHGVSSEQLLLVGYLLVSVVLFVSLLLSLNRVFSIIRTHRFQWIERIRFINTNKEGTPFSFFNFVFWNENIDLQTETGQQIFRHELVHVKEHHTLDKLMIQFLLVFYWCNPFFWFIRRELQLIHEFIADKKAVGESGAAALAAMILNASYPSRFSSITSQFFQTSIKRRLTMLTKIQNPKINYLSRVLALPILAATVLAFTLRTKTIVVSDAKLDKEITVVIDAGHGFMPDGKPNGVSIDGANEDNIVLVIAKKIKELNTNPKLKFVLTRTSSELVDLHKRVDIARDNKADLFVSLHVDAHMQNDHRDLTSPQSLTSGFAVYVSNKQTVYQGQSEKFASIVQQQLNTVYATNPYLLKRKVGIWVLDQNVCPSVLVECGFLSDEKDRKYISNEENQTQVAQKILQAIETYVADGQNSTRTSNDTVPQKQQQEKQVTIKNQTASSKQDAREFNLKNLKNPPLYMVDGKEVSGTEMDKIDPETIESISVLKGDTATQKYGKKASNGAIEIRLKNANTIREVTLAPTVTDTLPKTQPIFSEVEREASVDQKEWIRFLQKNLQPFIVDATKNGAKPGTYTVKLRFIVAKDGNLSDLTTLNDPGYGLANKVVEMMKDSPKWNPGLQNGKAVNSYKTQPITFVIAEN